MNTTVILTTHDMGDVDALCKRIVIIDKGQMLYDNDIDHLRKFFGAYRTLKVRLKGDMSEKVKEVEKALEAMDVSVSSDDEWISVLVNEEKCGVLDVLSTIQKEHKVTDMQLQEISTEEVIKKIYTEGV